MVSMLDDTIANLTKAFEKKNILDNTIIIFTSDVTLYFESVYVLIYELFKSFFFYISKEWWRNF
jgi:hypothetical protein